MNIHWRKIQKTFDRDADGYGVNFRQTGWPILHKLIRSNAVSQASPLQTPVLDAGCGNGMLLQKLASLPGDLWITGIDFSINMLIQTKKSSPDRLLPLGQGLLQQLPFKSNLFGTTFCLNTLYNLPNQENLLNVLLELKRVTKLNGRILFEIRNKSNPLIRYVFKRNHSQDLPLCSHSIPKVENQLEEIGLEIVSKKPVFLAGATLTPAMVFCVTKTNRDT